MKYIEKYNRYIDDDLVIYRMSKEGKLVQVKHSTGKNGYEFICCEHRTVGVHRLIYEAFVGMIPDGMDIDHINTIKNDNRLENLRCVTHKENCNNSLSKRHVSEAMKGKRKAYSEFGIKFKHHFGITCSDNPKLYNREHLWYLRHSKLCSWEN